MMGIKFNGHPDLRRILMWDGYPFYPLRKDFRSKGAERNAGSRFHKTHTFSRRALRDRAEHGDLERSRTARPPAGLVSLARRSGGSFAEDFE